MSEVVYSPNQPLVEQDPKHPWDVGGATNAMRWNPRSPVGDAVRDGWDAALGEEGHAYRGSLFEEWVRRCREE